MHMLNIYTSRQKLIGRNVVYNLHDFFDNTVVNAIRQKRYELTEEDRATLGKEGYITGVSGGIIFTKYGEMSLEDISITAKAILSIRYLAAVDTNRVLNITDVSENMEDVLKTAESANISLLWCFKYCSTSWRDIYITACFDDDTVMSLNEYSENITEFGEGFGKEIYLSFGDDTAHFELFSPSRRIVIKADNTAQKALLFKTLRTALTNRTAKVTEFKKLNADGEDFDLNKVIIEDTENDDIFGRLVKTGQTYIVVIDGDKNRDNYCYIYDEINMRAVDVPIYEIVIKADDTDELWNSVSLQEKYVPSDSSDKNRFEFTVQKHKFESPLIKEDFPSWNSVE